MAPTQKPEEPILLASLWIMFSRLVAPPLIQRAYRKESLPIVNIIISKRATYSIEDYLTKWDKITWRGLLILLSTGLVVLVITRPEFQRLVDARPGIRKRPPQHSTPRYLWKEHASGLPMRSSP